jgi:histidinol-phosphate/aromatic aminotransferase/cobyric acid decarboxylase-like protein
MTAIEHYIREDLRNIRPYSSARDEFTGPANAWLDANENSLVTDYNRYPDPLQKQLKQVIAKLKGVKEEHLFLGNGSDEVLDLILRLTCMPYRNCIAFPVP